MAKHILLWPAFLYGLYSTAQLPSSIMVQSSAYSFTVKRNLATNIYSAGKFSTTVYKGGPPASPDPTFLPTLFNYVAFMYSMGDTVSLTSPLITNGIDSSISVGYTINIPSMIDRNRLQCIRIQAIENGVVIGTSTKPASQLLIGNNYISSTFYNVNHKELLFRLTVTSNTNSTAVVSITDFAADRLFMVLPVTFRSVTTRPEGKNVKINWTVEAETDVKHYEIESSTDGRNFKRAGIITAHNHHSYSFTDKDPGDYNKLFYRIKSVDIDGSFQYSQVSHCDRNGSAVKFLAYPSPADDHIIIRHENPRKGQLLLYNSSGSLMLTKNVETHETRTRLELQGLPAGAYIIKYMDNTEHRGTTIIKR